MDALDTAVRQLVFICTWHVNSDTGQDVRTATALAHHESAAARYGDLAFPGRSALGFFLALQCLDRSFSATVLVSILAYRVDLKTLWLLDTKPFRLLGVSSGSYYVLHMPIFVWIVPVIAMITPAALSFQAPALTGLVIIAIVLATNSVPAILSYLIIEEPGIALGRRIMSSRRLRLA